jgi:predicted ATPase/class 3 adenylate cyclase
MMRVMAPTFEQPPLPQGTVTFLFSDMEGSTAILERYGASAGTALDRHHRIYQGVVDRHHGVIFETVGDAVYAAFASAGDAVAAALDAHRALAADPWTEVGGRVACRISLHSGVVEQRAGHYFGAPLFRAARLQALAYGEQTVVSAATAALVSGQLPPGAVLIDRGVHRLKDLHEPEHVFELQHPDLRTEFPPLRSLDSRPHNLPIQLSSFVGRDDELTAVGALVREHRLVTLLGPGGIGKTRLALQVAADQIDAFPDGAWFVDLAAITDPGAIADAISAVLHVAERPNQPVLQTLSEHLGKRKLLLVLDNLEQLLPGAAPVVAQLLAAAPEIRVLTTSRATLRIRGEVEHVVPPLTAGAASTPDAELPGAIALFLARARDIRPDFAITPETGPLVAAICNRLDGLPLAIELAASRLRLFSLAALADRIEKRLPVLTGGARDLPERQQTLRATIAWSDELLAAADRELFHRLGVFAGSFGFEGAAAVAGRDVDVEAGLAALLDQSLIRRLDSLDESRFAMLETVREFATEALGTAQQDVAMHRLADYVCVLARRSTTELLDHRQGVMLRTMDAELSNIRATLEWLQGRGDAARLPDLVADLARYWSIRSTIREATRWVDAAELLVEDQESNVRGRLYRARAIATPGPLPAKTAMERAVAIHRARGDTEDLVGSLVTQTFVANSIPDYDLTIRAGSEAITLARTIGDLRMEGMAYANIAVALTVVGRLDEAEAGVHKAVELLSKVGDRHGVAAARDRLGLMARARADLPAAAAFHEASAIEFADIGDRIVEASCRLNLAMARSMLGDWRAAAVACRRALELARSAEDPLLQLSSVSIGASVLEAAGEMAGAGLLWAMSARITLTEALPIDPMDRDEEGFARCREELGAAYVSIEAEAGSASLEEATSELETRLRRLLEDRPTPGVSE